MTLKPFRFDRCWTFDADPVALWEALVRTDDYRRWWPWLRELSGDGLVPGGRSDCVVRAPIPYTLRFTVTVVGLEAGKWVDAAVDGDLRGPARLEIGGPGGRRRGSQIRLAWEMELRRPMLRTAARFGRPVMEWGHDWVVSTGFEQFCRSALRVQDRHDSCDSQSQDPDNNPDRGSGAARYGT